MLGLPKYQTLTTIIKIFIKNQEGNFMKIKKNVLLSKIKLLKI